MIGRHSIFVLLFFPQLGITTQFFNEHLYVLTNSNLPSCTIKVITELYKGVGTLNIYENSTTSSLLINQIAKELFSLEPPVPTVRTNSTEDTMYKDKIWLTAVGDPRQLRFLMSFLREINHEHLIVCITYPSEDPLEELSELASTMWIKKIPRNVIFIVSNYEGTESQIIGVPGYNLDNCEEIHLLRVAFCRGDVLIKTSPTFYPEIKNLGGCQLSVMVQPMMLPYVDVKDRRHPGGFANDILGSLAVLMNFTPKYVRSSENEDILKHIGESDLHMSIDLAPRPLRPPKADRFAISTTFVAFMVPAKKTVRSGYRLFVTPLNKSIWVGIALVLLAILLISHLSNNVDTSSVLLKMVGSLLGIGVGGFPNVRWMNIFQWFWLLASFIITQTYVAMLKKEFTVPTMDADIKTMEELIASPLDILCTTLLRDRYSNRSVETWPAGLADRCRIVSLEYLDNFYDNLRRSGTMNNTARIGSVERLGLEAPQAPVHIIRHYMMNEPQYAEVYAGSAYMFKMERAYMYILQSGLVQFWRENHKAKNYTLYRKTEPASDLDFMKYCMGFLLAGLSVSVICFLAELTAYQLFSAENQI